MVPERVGNFSFMSLPKNTWATHVTPRFSVLPPGFGLRPCISGPPCSNRVKPLSPAAVAFGPNLFAFILHR